MAIKITKTKEPATAPRSGNGGNTGGRPRIPVPQPILDALTRATEVPADESLKAVFESETIARKFVGQCIKGARELNLRLFKTVTVREDGSAQVNFRTESKTAVAELFT